MADLLNQWQTSQSSSARRRAAIVRALESLPPADAARIEAQAVMLGKGVRLLGRITALEVLAALGLLIEDAHE
jgi:hypothetical protein